MASALQTTKDKATSFLAKQVIGPVPMWGILGTLALGLGYWWYKRR